MERQATLREGPDGWYLDWDSGRISGPYVSYEDALLKAGDPVEESDAQFIPGKTTRSIKTLIIFIVLVLLFIVWLAVRLAILSLLNTKVFA